MDCVEHQLTEWCNPHDMVELRWRECPQCFAIDSMTHDKGCDGRKIVRTCKTTQFGPCTYLEWMTHLIIQRKDKHKRAGFIHNNTEGMISLWDRPQLGLAFKDDLEGLNGG